MASNAISGGLVLKFEKEVIGAAASSQMGTYMAIQYLCERAHHARRSERAGNQAAGAHREDRDDSSAGVSEVGCQFRDGFSCE